MAECQMMKTKNYHNSKSALKNNTKSWRGINIKPIIVPEGCENESDELEFFLIFQLEFERAVYVF